MSELDALRRQAKAGDLTAQAHLAHALLVGRETPRAPQEAFDLLSFGCAKNHPGALLLAATVTALGFYREQNLAEAFTLLRRAAAAGSESAKGQVAVLQNARGEFDFAPWGAPLNAVRQPFEAPVIYTIKNFMPRSACDWMIAQSRDRLTPATVFDSQGAGQVVEANRTNSGAGFSSLHPDLVVQMINLRIAAATGLPLLNQEAINVLRYGLNEEYKAHFDFLTGREVESYAQEIEFMGQRQATFLVYLNDGYGGGETAFPRLNWKFKGDAGDALLFWNLNADGEGEPFSLHAGLPVTSGEKWLISKWIRAKQAPLI